jgi:tetratricopeptide (TPR) repeat protein
MKNITKIIFIAGLLITLASCKKDFLEIADPNNPTAETYYTSVNNAQLAMNGVYSQFHDERLFFGELFYITCYSTGEAEYIHPESRYTDFNNYNYNSTNELIGNYYQGWYRIVGRANAVITGINSMLAAGTYDNNEVASLMKMKGQCYFLRGLAYSYLVRSFGEKMPTNPAYTDNTPGVIISDTVILSKEQMYKDRSTCSEVYKNIVKDFQMAESLLPASWPATELGKATKGAAQAYLGETYVYLKNWPDAKTAFDKVLANSQYKLVTEFSQNFDYKHIQNVESLFEVGFNNDVMGYFGTYVYRLLARQSWGTTKIPSTTINHFSSTVVLNDQTLAAGLASKVLAYGDQKKYIDSLYKISVPLKGNSWKDKDSYLTYIRPLTTIPFYRTDGVTLQAGVRVWLDAVSPKDPRLAATVYVPKSDNIVVFNPQTGAWNKILYDYPDYGWKKYIPDSVEVEAAETAGMGNNGGMNMNFRVMRLDDVYLYYAEVMHNLSDDATAKEYINKIVRRANKKPINVASDVDVNPADIMAEIRNQTYLEFCLEAKIWFHFRRWNREVIEWGSLGFKANKNECLPIPQGEFDSNPAITKQNIGYN